MRARVVEDGFCMAARLKRGLKEVRRTGTAVGYRVLSDDLDSRDFTDPGAAVISRNAVSVIVGGVVSLQLGHPGTLAALPGALDDLAGRVLRPVAASALFA